MPHLLPLQDFEPATDDVLQEVIVGLSQKPRRLPAKLLYDTRGSRLFDQVCLLDEYYVTRTELAILRQHAPEIAEHIGPGALLMEFGSGSSEKTRLLLDALDQVTAYVPIDISRGHLVESARAIAHDYPDVVVRPVCADYESTFEIPSGNGGGNRRIVYFPGSTVGNFHPDEAHQFLTRMNVLARGSGGSEPGGLLIGVDLVKDPRVLRQAYNDDAGITAAFNLNMLARINRETGANFDLDAFRHLALFNEEESRVEMHLESTADQVVSIGGTTVAFDAGERIWTESSYKYTVEGFSRLAASAGFRDGTVWTDAKRYFAVLYFPAEE